jgi:N6-adenosine-specific RNA methylase IME4
MSIKKRQANLPVKPLDLQKWILVGKVKLKAQIQAIKCIKQLEEGQAAVAAALSDTQDLAEELLYAEAQLGEVLEKIPDKKASSGGGTRSLPPTITKKQSHYAQELSQNEDAIARVVAKAREQGEVPVRQHVLKDIQANKPKPETPPLPPGKFNVIYADPPWKYGDKLIEGYGAAEHHYPSMDINELCALAVKGITADNAVLFIWVTSPFLDACWPIIRAWGFEYKSSFVWDKVKHNYGHYNSVRHEMLLICTRGSYLPDSRTLHDSVVTKERSNRHSEKPEYFRKLISSMYPQRKKLELFGRKKVKGWTVYGNDPILQKEV